MWMTLAGFQSRYQHLLNSFPDALGIIVVVVHQGFVDSPAPQVCILLGVCYIAVHNKGGA